MSYKRSIKPNSFTFINDTKDSAHCLLNSIQLELFEQIVRLMLSKKVITVAPVLFDDLGGDNSAAQ